SAALVPEGMEIPPASLAMGVPAKVRRRVTEEEQRRFREGAQHYVESARVYLEEQAREEHKLA
ncbi:MAG: gamma carbonic anhydrase family protein, partial [Pseudomonadota bacterium]